ERGDAVAARHGARAIVHDRVEERLGLREQCVALVEAPARDLERLSVAPADRRPHPPHFALAEVDRYVLALLKDAEPTLRARRYARRRDVRDRAALELDARVRDIDRIRQYAG